MFLPTSPALLKSNNPGARALNSEVGTPLILDGTDVLDGTDAGEVACERGSCAGAGRVISRLKPIHFSFAGG